MADDPRAALRERLAEIKLWRIESGEVEQEGGTTTEIWSRSITRDELADAVLALLDDWVPRAEHERHTQTSTDVGPDYCAECSARIQEWVHWPCTGLAAEAERDAARADLVALLEGMEQVGWRKVHQTDDGPVDDLCPMSKYCTDYQGAGYVPVYRLSPSAAALHASLTDKDNHDG